MYLEKLEKNRSMTRQLDAMWRNDLCIGTESDLDEEILCGAMKDV